MLKESVTSASSIWATMHSWFMPSVFSVRLNLMIGTIFTTSSLSSHKPKEEEGDQHQQQRNHEDSPKPQHLAISPSMLQRLKSVSFYNYRSQEPNTHFGKTLEMETLHGFLQQGSGLGQEQEGESEKGTPFLTRSPSMPVCPKKPAFHRPITVLSYPQEPEQHGAQAEEEEQVDLAGDDELEEQDEQEVEVEEDKEEDEQSLNDVNSQLKDNQVKKIKTGTKPTSGEISWTSPFPTSSNV